MLRPRNPARHLAWLLCALGLGWRVCGPTLGGFVGVASPTARRKTARNAVSFHRAGLLPGQSRETKETLKPLLVFLPGIDGASREASDQFRRLAPFFDCWALRLPPDDRSDLDSLVASVESFIEERRAERPVLLVAESLGAVVALSLAVKRPNLPHALCLLNPATSYRRSALSLVAPVLPRLPEQLYSSLPAVVTPLFGKLGWYDQVVQEDSATGGQGPFAELLRISRGLSKVLPPDTLQFRESAYLREGVRRLEPLLLELRLTAPTWLKQTLLVAGDADAVLPSVAETERLLKLLPGAQRKIIPGGPHACFDDTASVNLLSLLTDSGILQSLTKAAPAELRLEPESWLDASLLQAKTWVSPVFLSVLPGGRIARGLPQLAPPPAQGAPILFVGNHQLFSLDGIFVIEEFLREQRRLITAMVYPPLLDEVSPLAPLPYPFPGSRQLFEKFKVMPTSARNLLRALRPNRTSAGAALLFPGGAREVFKRKGEEYKLFWPPQPEFIRIAAKANATIIPFSGIGSDEFFAGTLLDSSELLKLPVVGDWLRDRTQDLPSFVEDDVFVPPVPAPRLQGPRRNYFLFGQPVSTASLDHRDRGACSAVYAEVRQQVEAGLHHLLQAREEDPFEETAARYPWEQATGVQAPSFSLEGRWGQLQQPEKMDGRPM